MPPTEPSNSAATAKPATMQIFRGADAPDLGDAGHMRMTESDPKVLAALGKLSAEGMDDGAVTKCLFSAPGFSLHYAWFKPGFPLPLHSHDSDCLYYITAGSLRLGTETLEAGDGVFLPGGTPYTYAIGDEGVELVEFRNEEDFDISFKGRTESYWDKVSDKVKANRDGWADAVPPSRKQVQA